MPRAISAISASLREAKTVASQAKQVSLEPPALLSGRPGHKAVAGTVEQHLQPLDELFTSQAGS